MQGAANSAPQLTWTTILVLMSFFGMFGGILDVLGMIDIRRLVDVEFKQINRVFVPGKRLIAALLLGGIGGIGGAFAMLFVIVAAAKLDTADTPINKLLLASLGVVSGFLGFRVLRGVARGVERQIQESEVRLEARTAEQIQATKNHAEQIVEKYDAITSGMRFVEENKETLPSVQFQVTSTLEELRERIPADREVTMVLGEIYRKTGRYQQAIDLLTEFLNTIERSGRNKDIADARYNRAGYYNLMADRLADGNEKKQQLKNQAYEDLKESIRLSPENKEDAIAEGDLESLRQEERFTQLVA
jgi:tetratricopeptide (TPR) repeat protein